MYSFEYQKQMKKTRTKNHTHKPLSKSPQNKQILKDLA